MWAMSRRRCRHSLAHHVGKINATLLDNPTFGQHTADTSTSFRALPTIANKRRLAIDCFQPLAYLLLKSDKVVFDGLDIRLL